MSRIVFVSILTFWLQASTAFAQSAEKMFSETSHDFGGVARAAKVEYPFVIKNIYKEDVHVAGVRTSCGCTQPRIEKDTIKPNETGAVIAAFNTNAFTGQHGARVTVTFDRPFYSEVQLQVNGYIRTDVVFNPNQVAFGTVDQGTAADKKVHIEYAGRNDWKILDVKSPSPYLTATVKETDRKNGRVGYDVLVHLNDKAPLGYLKNQITLVTNDGRAQLPLNVEGLIAAELTVSPSPLTLGTIHPRETVKKQLVVRGRKPFHIVNIRCEDKSFTFKTSDEAKDMHLIPVTFVAADKPGRIAQKIVIETDLASNPTAEISALGQIATPLAER